MRRKGVYTMSENKNNEVEQNEELDVNHLMQIRRDKLKELQDAGKNPFEITKYDRTNTAGEIKAKYEEFEQKDVKVAGRIIAKRIMEKHHSVQYKIAMKKSKVMLA